MNVGLYFDLRNPPPWAVDPARHYAFTLELVEEAEHLGAHSVWLSEHHRFEDGYLPQPLTFAAAVAARTSTVRIGTAVLLAPLRRAIQIAEEATIVDLLSSGRLDLGLGAGYRVPEFELFGADITRRYGLTDAAAREVRGHLADPDITPQPVQDPVPIWLGYQGPQGAGRAGRLGVGLLSAQGRLHEPYVAALTGAGHDPAAARMAGPVSGFVTDEPDRDWDTVSTHLAYQWDSYRSAMVEGTDTPAPPPVDPAKWRQQRDPETPPRFAYGTPEEVARAVRLTTGAAPVETVFLWASIAGMEESVALRHVQMVCTELSPLLAGGA